MRNVEQQAASARALFDQMRFVEAYSIYRRVYNLLPFGAEDVHARHIGCFIKTLNAVDRRGEIAFYHRQLTQLHARCPTPALAFQLAYTAIHLVEPDRPLAVRLAEGVLAAPQAAALHLRARLLLAYCFSHGGADVAACRRLIFDAPISTDEDPANLDILEVWRAKVLKDEGNVDEAARRLRRLLRSSRRPHWFTVFSAKVIEANLALQVGRTERAVCCIGELKRYFRGRAYRCIQYQMEALERVVKEKRALEKLRTEAPIRAECNFQFLPERDKLRRTNPAHFLRTRGWVSPGIVVTNLC